MKKIVDMAHDIVHQYIAEDGICADFTLGQGNDALFMAKDERVQKVYGFDIQKEAIELSKELLTTYGVLHKVELIQDGHEKCASYIKEKLCVGMFNFGYLPHGDQTITTNVETSSQAVKKALSLLCVHGALVLVLYPGHTQGKEESLYFETWVSKLHSREYSVLKVQLQNYKEAPYILLIERLR